MHKLFTFILFVYFTAVDGRLVRVDRRVAAAGHEARIVERMDAVPPLGSSTFNPGTLSNPVSIVPLKQLIDAEQLGEPEVHH
ncbi:hypothetical protein BV25DRAFT_1918507 [Artomyces pyxidatus]|uniref:Uncharacterized protein n=1 Tax=Artomyces pyxidatus TaxID=48021 RepID=A0ACB8STK2_9AGAM|nr:hypothetical protein BV25DRAFT_1918507 [Artomyces pyxidatus]